VDRDRPAAALRRRPRSTPSYVRRANARHA
jgi:hypothetical protein